MQDRRVQGPEQRDHVGLELDDRLLGPVREREEQHGRDAEEDQPDHVARGAPVADDVVETEYLHRGGLGTILGPTRECPSTP